MTVRRAFAELEVRLAVLRWTVLEEFDYWIMRPLLRALGWKP